MLRPRLYYNRSGLNTAMDKTETASSENDRDRISITPAITAGPRTGISGPRHRGRRAGWCLGLFLAADIKRIDPLVNGQRIEQIIAGVVGPLQSHVQLAQLTQRD